MEVALTTVDAALQTHLQQSTLTLARLWLITRTDGTRLGFTDASEALAIGPFVFEAAAGFTGSAIASDHTASVNNADVESYIDSEHITSEDIQAGRYYDAKIEVFMVNYLDLPTALPSPKAPAFLTGYIGEVESYGNDSFKFEVRGLTQLLQQKVGLNTEELCQADLFDQNCRADSTGHIHQGTVVRVNPNNRIIAAVNLPQAADYFGNGKVTFTSGANLGLSKEILQHEDQAAGNNPGAIFHLSQPMPFRIELGDKITVIAGCRKTLDACNGKFENIENYFAGFPMLPGADYYASGKSRHDPTGDLTEEN